MNETALVLRGGWPGGGLRKMAGIWSEEIDALYPNPPQRIVPSAGNALGMTGEHPVKDYCERVHAEGATVLATYKTDFYAGMPALTVNRYGAGRVYYLAARPAADPFLDALTRALASQAGVSRCLDVELPEGVTVQKRSGGGRTFYFLHNFRREDQVVDLGAIRLKDVSDGRVMTGTTTLAPFASFVLETGRDVTAGSSRLAGPRHRRSRVDRLLDARRAGGLEAVSLDATAARCETPRAGRGRPGCCRRWRA